MRCGANGTRPPRRTTCIRPFTRRGGRSAPRRSSSRRGALSLVADTDVDELEPRGRRAPRHATPAGYRAALAVYSGELLPENRYEDWAVDRRDVLARLHAELSEELAALAPADGLHSLPADASSFVGRGHELGELSSLLAGTRLLTLAGTGGVGKTRLALELARGAETSYEAGAVLVELAAVDDPLLVVDAVAAALDVRALPDQDAGGRSRRLPRAARCSSSCWTTASTCSRRVPRSPTRCCALRRGWRSWRRAGSRCAFPARSCSGSRRSHPRSGAAARRPTSCSATKRCGSSSSARRPPSRASSSTTRTRSTSRASASASTACRLRSSLPPAASARSAPQRSRTARRSLPSPPLGEPCGADAAADPRGDAPVEPRPARAGRAAAASGGSRSSPAASSSPRSRPCAWATASTSRDCADVLARLVEKSLVAVDGAGRERRYRLLETVRLYARERLDEAGETAALAERHARWALALAERERDSPRLELEAANLRAAFDTLLAREPADALRLAVALWPFWLRRIDLAEARAPLRRGARSGARATTLRAEALFAAAAIDFRPARSRAAWRSRRRAKRRVRARRRARRVARDAVPRRVRRRNGRRNGDAVTWLERALELARREGFAGAGGDRRLLARRRAWVARRSRARRGAVAQSIELVRKRRRTRPSGSPRPINIAGHAVERPDGRSGLRIVFEETLAAVRRDLAADAAAAMCSRTSRRSRGHAATSPARANCSRGSRALRTRPTTSAVEADVLVRRGYLELAEGSVDDARARLERALELRRRMNNRRGVGLALVRSRTDRHDGRRLRDAERHLAEARDIFRRAGDRWGLASTLWRTADLALDARTELDGAEAALREALRRARRDAARALDRATRSRDSRRSASLRGDAEQAATALFADARRRYEAATTTSAASRLVDERRRVLC